MSAAGLTGGTWSNLFGALSPDLRNRLAAVMANPTQATWEAAYSIVLHGNTFTTLWQAWLAVDPNAVRSKPCNSPWPRVPDQMTVYRAIRHATNRQGQA